MSLLLSVLGLTLLMSSPSAMAALGDMGRNAAESADGVGLAIKQWSLVIGLVFVVGSIIGMATAKKTNTPISYSFYALGAGLALLTLSTLISEGSDTIYDSDNSELENLDLSQVISPKSGDGVDTYHKAVYQDKLIVG